MKGADRAIVIALPVLLLAVAFYLMVLSPKRQEASTLAEENAALEQQVDDQNAVADFGEAARKDFPKYYSRMIVLGKAVPESADSASMLVQLNSISGSAGVEFRGLELGEGSAASSEVSGEPPPAATTEPSVSEVSAESTTETTEGEATTTTEVTATTTAPVPATETAAAVMPIGATVGPAGLPTLPYDLTFRGDFFQIADFIAGVDRLIGLKKSASQVAANGRLLTIDGFSLKGGRPGSSPELDALFAMTSYVTPGGQGLTLGASPTAPGAPLGGDTVPASAAVVP
jgi:Tfp pilus assembly protein PilO